MANKYSLIDVENLDINKYLIIRDKEQLNDDDIKDSGNIVILSTPKRTDLYIGDEHIAGGYGFSEPETSNNVLERLTNLENRKFDDIYKEDENQSENHNSISIDTENNKIFINDNDNYELKLKDKENNIQELYIDQYSRPTIYNIEFWYLKNNERVKYEDNETIYDIINNNSYIPSEIYFDYKGSYNFTKEDMKISYTYIYSSDNSDKSGDLIIDKESITINLLNSNKKAIEIKFSDKDKENLMALANKECIMNLEIKIELSNNTINLIKPFSKWAFTYPCIYGTEISNFYDNLSDNHNIFSIAFNNSCEVIFDHGNTKTYGFVYVPQNILGKYIDVKDIVCISNSSNIRFNWEIINSRTFSGVHYWALKTPQQYKGNVKWTFSLNK